MSDIQLTLSVDETNLILESLGEQPFVKVHELIRKLHQQAQQQLKPTNKAVPDVANTHMGQVGSVDAPSELKTGTDA